MFYSFTNKNIDCTLNIDPSDVLILEYDKSKETDEEDRYSIRLKSADYYLYIITKEVYYDVLKKIIQLNIDDKKKEANK